MPRSSFLPPWRFSGIHRTYPPSKDFKAACVKRSPCSILKNSRETLQSGATPKKRVRFSLPREGNLKLDDDNSLNFKGFTTEDLRQMDKLQISIEKIKRLEETLTLRQKVAVTEAVRRNNGIIPFRMGRGRNRKAYFLCQKKLDDDNSLNFKGFTTEDLRQMDKLQVSIEKIKRLEETLTLRQKVAVTEAVRRNNGIIPFRLGRGRNRKAYFLCQKKLERCISKTGQMVKTGNVSLESRKMQCRICCRIAYLPASQQAEVGGSNMYFCNDCFEKSGICTIPPASVPQHNSLNTFKTGFPQRNVPTVIIVQDSELLEGSEIIISSVRSLATKMVSDGPSPNEENKLVEIGKVLDGEAMPVHAEKLEIATYPNSYDHQVNNKVISAKKSDGKIVTIETADGIFTVLIPCSGEGSSFV